MVTQMGFLVLGGQDSGHAQCATPRQWKAPVSTASTSHSCQGDCDKSERENKNMTVIEQWTKQTKYIHPHA